jgi:hypothetical protein
MKTNIDQNIKQKIEQLYLNTPNNVHGVGFGTKQIDGGYTDIDSIVFTVEKKRAKNELSRSELLPTKVIINGQTYATDVVESPKLKPHACFSSTDPDVTRLQPARSGIGSLIPFRGGQEIIPFPYGWEDIVTPQKVGTLGGFVIDNNDNKIVGITNAHVAIYDSRILIAADRDLLKESTDTYNSLEAQPFFIFGDQNPGALTLVETDNGQFLEYFLVAKYIKKYYPLYLNSMNYIDCALLVMNPNALSSDSYKVWQPIGTPENSSFLPFASTEEIDSLSVINTFLYATGSTTGPKGYDGAASCRLVVEQMGFTATIPYGDTDLDFGDLILYRYQDASAGPSLPGDSGSLVLADIDGVKKIIGLNFAGSSVSGVACRIDRIASVMNIKAWDNTVNLSTDAIIPEPSCITIDIDDSRTSQPTIEYNNKTYYQAGFTTNDGCEDITNV